MKKYLFNLIIKAISKILVIIDKIIRIYFKKNSFLPLIHDNIENNQYYSVNILNNKYQFFCPSSKTLGRVESILKREPETINWINNFKNNKKIVFWDIGANIGLYSIYAAIKHKDIEIISFEPSTSNTRALSRNISINNFHKKIKIFQLALSDKENMISYFNETKFVEGNSNSNFNYEFNYQGEYLTEDKIKNKYSIFGTNINELIKENVIKIPNYIKIDVDGIEDLILKGSTDLLSNNELKELSIELNFGNKSKYNYIDKLLKSYGFERHISLNRNLFNDKNYIIKENENLNTIYIRL